MNKARCKELRLVLAKIGELTAILEETKESLQAIIDEEQEAYDNLPEGIQSCERGEQMEEYIDSMQAVFDALDELDTEDLYQTIEEIACG